MAAIGTLHREGEELYFGDSGPVYDAYQRMKGELSPRTEYPKEYATREAWKKTMQKIVRAAVWKVIEQAIPIDQPALGRRRPHHRVVSPLKLWKQRLRREIFAKVRSSEEFSRLVERLIRPGLCCASVEHCVGAAKIVHAVLNALQEKQEMMEAEMGMERKLFDWRPSTLVEMSAAFRAIGMDDLKQVLAGECGKKVLSGNKVYGGYGKKPLQLPPRFAALREPIDTWLASHKTKDINEIVKDAELAGELETIAREFFLDKLRKKEIVDAENMAVPGRIVPIADRTEYLYPGERPGPRAQTAIKAIWERCNTYLADLYPGSQLARCRKIQQKMYEKRQRIIGAMARYIVSSAEGLPLPDMNFLPVQAIFEVKGTAELLAALRLRQRDAKRRIKDGARPRIEEVGGKKVPRGLLCPKASFAQAAEFMAQVKGAPEELTTIYKMKNLDSAPAVVTKISKKGALTEHLIPDGSYDSVVKKVSKLEEDGADLAYLLQETLKGKEISCNGYTRRDATEVRGILASLAVLLVGIEPLRNPATLFTNGHLLRSWYEGDRTFSEVIEASPMVPVGVVKAGRALHSELGASYVYPGELETSQDKIDDLREAEEGAIVGAGESLIQDVRDYLGL